LGAYVGRDRITRHAVLGNLDRLVQAKAFLCSNTRVEYTSVSHTSVWGIVRPNLLVEELRTLYNGVHHELVAHGRANGAAGAQPLGEVVAELRARERNV